MLAWVRKGCAAKGWAPASRGAAQQATTGSLCVIQCKPLTSQKHRMEGAAAVSCVSMRIGHARQGRACHTRPSNPLLLAQAAAPLDAFDAAGGTLTVVTGD